MISLNAMRVHHIINQAFGLEDLREKRLKVARISELNDPFEFAAVDLSDTEFRQAWELMKQSMSNDYGLLCFSRSWSNPVLWAHYADKHRGLCLGFDIPDELLKKVEYTDERVRSAEFIAGRHAQADQLAGELDSHMRRALTPAEAEARKCSFIRMTRRQIRKGTYSGPENLSFMEQVLATKFSHWSYEDEYRLFVPLMKETEGLQYQPFSEQLKLVEVTAGIRSSVTREEIDNVLGTMAGSVDVCRVRESYRKFAVVTDERTQF